MGLLYKLEDFKYEKTPLVPFVMIVVSLYSLLPERKTQETREIAVYEEYATKSRRTRGDRDPGHRWTKTVSVVVPLVRVFTWRHLKLTAVVRSSREKEEGRGGGRRRVVITGRYFLREWVYLYVSVVVTSYKVFQL